VGQNLPENIRERGSGLTWLQPIFKAGPAYDLPIAIGILIAGDQITPTGEQTGGESGSGSSAGGIPFITERCLFLSELGLDGRLRHTRGILSMVILTRELGIAHIFLPAVDRCPESGAGRKGSGDLPR
jgi:predicted ATPase with chaperone activity